MCIKSDLIKMDEQTKDMTYLHWYKNFTNFGIWLFMYLDFILSLMDFVFCIGKDIFLIYLTINEVIKQISDKIRKKILESPPGVKLIPYKQRVSISLLGEV